MLQKTPSRQVVLAGAVALGSCLLALIAPPAQADDPGTGPWTRMTDPRITESSGLARSGYEQGVVWTHNDRGDEARLFAVGRGGATRAVLQLQGVVAQDWEAMTRVKAGGVSWLYVGDIGDNARSRAEVTVHRFLEPRVLEDTVVRPTSYRLRYEDGSHDAEALLVDPRTGRISVVTKDVSGGGVYEAPETLGTDEVGVLRRVADAPPLVTDGTVLRDGRVVLRSYRDGFVSSGLGQPATAFPLPVTLQGESLASTADQRAVLVGSEGSDSPVYRVELPTG